MAVGPVVDPDVPEAFGQDADDVKGSASEADRSADDARVAAEPSHPQAMAQHHDVVIPRELVVRREVPTQRRNLLSRPPRRPDSSPGSPEDRDS